MTTKPMRMTKVRDLRTGDRTPWYTVEEDAYLHPRGKGVLVRVQYTDGGYGTRYWVDPDIVIEVLP